MVALLMKHCSVSVLVMFLISCCDSMAKVYISSRDVCNLAWCAERILVNSSPSTYIFFFLLYFSLFDLVQSEKHVLRLADHLE